MRCIKGNQKTKALQYYETSVLMRLANVSSDFWQQSISSATIDVLATLLLTPDQDEGVSVETLFSFYKRNDGDFDEDEIENISKDFCQQSISSAKLYYTS